jgi:WD40 repeat protein
LRVREVTTGRLVRLLLAPSPARAAAWSADGRYLASTHQDKRIRLWEVVTGRALRAIPLDTGRLAWSPDARELAAVDFNKVVVYETATGNPQRSFVAATGMLQAIAWSPDGKVLATGGNDEAVRLWEAVSGLALSAPSSRAVNVWRPGAAVYALAWSPDGKSLAAALAHGPAQVWNVPLNQKRRAVDRTGTPFAWAPDGKRLALGLGGAVRVWDADSGATVRDLLVGDGQTPAGAAWSPDGRTLIAAGSSYATQKFMTWEVVSGNVLSDCLDLGHNNAYWSAAWSPDGKTLAAGGNRPTQLWDVRAGRPVRELERGSQSLAWSPDCKLLADGTRAGQARLWAAESGKLLRTFEGHEIPHWVDAVAFAPDGKTLASGCRDRTVRLWDVGSGKGLHVLGGLSGMVQHLAWSPDGGALAVATDGDWTVKVFDAATGRPRLTLPGVIGGPLAWSPDGKRLAACASALVHLWDAADGNLLETFRGNTPRVTALYWSANGRTLAVGCDDQKVRRWTPGASRPPEILDAVGPGRAFSPDRRLLAGYVGNGLRVYPVEPGGPGSNLVLLGDSRWLAVGPDGNYRAAPKLVRDVVYVVETDQGQVTLTPDEFEQHYGWRNDPDKVRLGEGPPDPG